MLGEWESMCDCGIITKMTNNGSTSDELKIVIVGDGGCGKTSLLMVYAKGDFPEVSENIILVHFPNIFW